MTRPQPRGAAVRRATRRTTPLIFASKPDFHS
nr:MAG TPA: hypothetical protein [Caudoviricetes sp.]